MVQSSIATDFERIFHPDKIAIIGFSKEGIGFGSGILFSLRAIGYSGEIYLVNPKGGTFNGQPIYARIEDIPGGFDLAIIAVPAQAVAEALEACLKKGAAGAEIFSSGFKELGTPEGIALEQEVTRIAAKGLRVIGPNCFGIYCPKSGLTVLPGPDLSRRPGPIAFSSQSGGMAVDFANLGKSMGLGFSKVVSFGNGCDLRETELLRYFGADPQTGIITMYIEGIQDGDAFFAALKQTAARKPVIINKGGLSEAGSRAVQSHTASMGGSRRIWQSILRQANAVQVNDMHEMAQTAMAFALLPPKVYRNITVLGGGGALGVAAADAAEAYGIKIPPFEPELAARIDALLPRPGSSPGNPVDVANPFVAPKTLRQIMRLAAGDERIDLQIFTSLLHHYKNQAKIFGKPVKEITPYVELADDIQAVVAETGKPIAVILSNPKSAPDHLDVVEMFVDARRVFAERGIPVFNHLTEAFKALGHLNIYYERKHP
ncbi:MAG: CoA-binding protein [Desulfobacteraceae bacterium]|nr:CoA-binding protein [Desulfobacteraceae bacterium]